MHNYETPIWRIAESICQELNEEGFLLDKNSFIDLIFNTGFFVRWSRRKQLLEEVADYPLTLVWKGQLPDVKLNRHTTILPSTNIENSLYLMSQSKTMLMLLNSITHSLSERLLSAMYRRCIPVCNNNSLINKLFIDGKEMFFFGAKFENLHSTLEQVLTKNVDFDQIAESAFNALAEQYSPTRYAEKVLRAHHLSLFNQ